MTRYRTPQPIPEELAKIIKELHDQHPQSRCDLFKTQFGKCTCRDYDIAVWEGEGGNVYLG